MSAAQGVLTGCDSTHEWMLEWWWSNYWATNALPVAFLDFGLSDEARRWCAERGPVIPISGPAIPERGSIDGALASRWEEIYPAVWRSRISWFKKPAGLLRSPFSRTMWCDLDTEIRSDIRGALAHCAVRSGIGLCPEPEYAVLHARELGLLPAHRRLYNSGVIVFDRESPVIRAWAEASARDASTCMGDQDVLALVIDEGGWEVDELPAIYNWRMGLGENASARVIHWCGAWGKDEIRRMCRR